MRLSPYVCSCMCMHIVHARKCAWLSVTLLRVVGSFLSADDRVDFSCEWMKGAELWWCPYAGFLPVPQMEEHRLFIIISRLPMALTKTQTACTIPCLYFICPLMPFCLLLLLLLLLYDLYSLPLSRAAWRSMVHHRIYDQSEGSRSPHLEPVCSSCVCM